ncbi:MAG: host attachment protein [Waddliaceae bacterium]
MKKETWVIVANNSQARLFKLDRLNLVEIEAFIHPEGRLHERDLTADEPGVYHPRVGEGKYAMGQQHSPKKNEAILFAKKLGDFLENARGRGDIERLFIAASPGFLGLLRQEMTHHTSQLIAAEVDKDITHLKPEDIRGYFPIGL